MSKRNLPQYFNSPFSGSEDEEMADVEEEEAMWEARDVRITKTETEIGTMTATEPQTETDVGALATSD